jgi:alanyl-tRNA synthetase
MTERRYYTSDDLSCEARVIRCDAGRDGLYEIELDATLFHPQGGGQPADRGTLGGIPVVAVENRGERVSHWVTHPVVPGVVRLEVEGELRQIHARWHSAGHLIGCAGELYGWKPVKAHHWPGEGRITFAPGEYAVVPDSQVLAEKISGWIDDDLPRHIAFTAQQRQVSFGTLPAYGCGGTHVNRLGEVGCVRITGVKLKKGQLVVSYELSL